MDPFHQLSMSCFEGINLGRRDPPFVSGFALLRHDAAWGQPGGASGGSIGFHRVSYGFLVLPEEVCQKNTFLHSTRGSIYSDFWKC